MNTKPLKFFKILIPILCILEGYALFPLRLDLSDITYTFMQLAYCIFSGIIFTYIYNLKIKSVFVLSLLLNLTGFIIRVVVEYGEYSMIRDLTYLNSLIFIIAIPVVTTITYFLYSKLFKNLN